MAYEMPCTCDWVRCDKPPRTRIFNKWGLPVGDYCRPHGRKKLELERAKEQTAYPSIVAPPDPTIRTVL